MPKLRGDEPTIKMRETRGRPRKLNGEITNNLLRAVLIEADKSRLPYRMIEAHSGITEGALSSLKYNNPANPGADTLERIAAYLGFDIVLVPIGKRPKGPTRNDAMAKGRARALAVRRGCNVPPDKEADWQMIKRKRYTNAEAASMLGLMYYGDQE